MLTSVAERKLSRTPSGALNFFGGKIRALREKRGKSSKQVVESLQRSGWDVPEDVYSKVELGKRSLTDIELMAILDVLGCTPRDLEK